MNIHVSVQTASVCKLTTTLFTMVRLNASVCMFMCFKNTCMHACVITKGAFEGRPSSWFSHVHLLLCHLDVFLVRHGELLVTPWSHLGMFMFQKSLISQTYFFKTLRIIYF